MASASGTGQRNLFQASQGSYSARWIRVHGPRSYKIMNMPATTSGHLLFLRKFSGDEYFASHDARFPDGLSD